ncbi:unnamed protein product [Onchocerca flexuosa]|uniref:Ovule protein n=1 Tax=Onchocerca flexuosa TaxID=387005 RepID=A0A183HLR3_9BILA|nr:unnamed protein product [Onchocerca flexuosa]
MEEERSENNGSVPEMMVDYDISNILYEDDMDVAGEVVVETYSHQQQQQQQQQENSVYVCDGSTVQPLVYESYAVPDYDENNCIDISGNVFQNALTDEQQEILEIRCNPEDSEIFITPSDEINSDEVVTVATTNSSQNRRTDPTVMDEKLLNEQKDMEIMEEKSLEQQNELDQASTEFDEVRHQSEMMNNDTVDDGSVVRTDSNDSLQSSDNGKFMKNFPNR